ncbi:hypothetical protein DB41_FH00070 [Neochlamydia sp. TUME1]|uniref:tetratricopeptide repeat protein n=1 Tax=Neochlamydia sp. TUME1 TaxID=1478174 RepID=UPI00057C9E19|nr:tetratricopeptide repeat protein [Neochlamydia sp. TUME1]KIC76626.1 hypothetical protein DB41_FH00070 [Neochlamydia sp. TUME1]
MGQIYKEQGNLEQALKHVKRALDIGLKLFGENHSSVIKNYYNLGQIYHDQGVLNKAILYTKKSIATSLRYHGADDLYVLKGYCTLMTIYRRQGKLEQATKCFLISRKIIQSRKS